MNCITCGYDCSGLGDVRCPECGQWPMLARPGRAGAGTMMLLGLGATFVVYLVGTAALPFSLTRHSSVLELAAAVFGGGMVWGAYHGMRLYERRRRAVEQMPSGRLAALTLAAWSPIGVLYLGVYLLSLLNL